MIKREKIIIMDKEYFKIYSDLEVYIKDKKGVLFPVVVDLINSSNEYFETNITLKKGNNIKYN